MKNIADLFSKWLVEKEIIKIEDKELYAYGFWQGFILLFNFLTVIVIGFVANMFWQSIIFTIAYGSLRSFAGGFHARTQRNCYFYSILLLVLVLCVLRWNHWNVVSCTFIVLTSIIVVFKLAPVEDENKPFDDIEIVVYRHRSRIICSILVIITFLLLLTNQIEIAICITISILTTSVMLILGYIRNKYVTTKKYEKP